jgi:2,5-diamino-6-(ribosylamino)-4(3H)-pyrimidinone 5'-phosphate reductase
LRHVKKLYLVTTNSNHPALSFNDPGLEIILFEGQVNFQYLFTKLKSKGIDRVTIQSGGTMNAELIRSDLVDELSIVIAPFMVGGKDTPTIEDGLNIITAEDLSLVGEFELLKAKPLKESFLHLRYSRK